MAWRDLGPPCVWPEGWDPRGVLIRPQEGQWLTGRPFQASPQKHPVTTAPPCACPQSAPPARAPDGHSFLCRREGRGSAGQRDLPKATQPGRRPKTPCRPPRVRTRPAPVSGAPVVGQGSCGCTWRGSWELLTQNQGQQQSLRPVASKRCLFIARSWCVRSGPAEAALSRAGGRVSGALSCQSGWDPRPHPLLLQW